MTKIMFHRTFHWILVLCYITFHVQFQLVTSHDPTPDKDKNNNNNNDKKKREKLTDHDHNIQQTHTDFSNINLQNELSNLTPSDASMTVLNHIILQGPLHQRLTKMFEKAKTTECRTKIATHLGYYLNAIGKETNIPFALDQFPRTCPKPIILMDALPKDSNKTHVDYMNVVYQPKKDDDEQEGKQGVEYIDHPRNLRILYGVLTHNHPESTIRLIEGLYEEGHLFVIHVDGKESSDETYEALLEYSSERDYVYVLPIHNRIRVNWGGFSMVNATLQIMEYSIGEKLDFHKFILLSSTSYPLKSNYEIRDKLSQYPLDANLMEVVVFPNTPHLSFWNHYVECDDALHRIYRLTPLNINTHKAYLYNGSQWFIMSRDFVEYIVKSEPGTFVHQFKQYAEHVVVADEAFFGTILMNTEFCMKHHNQNFFYLHFDRWESDLDESERDTRKCLSADPNVCGRSPATLTMEYIFGMELSGSLFARKFSETDVSTKDYLDEKRLVDETYYRDRDAGKEVKPLHLVDTSFEGHGVMIVAKDSVQSENPLCLGMAGVESVSKIRLVPCFRRNVIPTLDIGWETGAVIQEELNKHTTWDIGPCSSDGNLKRSDETAEMEVTPGVHIASGPNCFLKIRMSDEMCLDIEEQKSEPGCRLVRYRCGGNKWNQIFAFGNGIIAPKSSIHVTIPSFVLEQSIKKTKTDQPKHTCLGVAGRGTFKRDELNSLDFLPKELLNGNKTEVDELLPISLWNWKSVVTVPCSDTGNVLQFLFVPLIVENSDSVILSTHDEL